VLTPPRLSFVLVTPGARSFFSPPGGYAKILPSSPPSDPFLWRPFPFNHFFLFPSPFFFLEGELSFSQTPSQVSATYLFSYFGPFFPLRLFTTPKNLPSRPAFPSLNSSSPGRALILIGIAGTFLAGAGFRVRFRSTPRNCPIFFLGGSKVDLNPPPLTPPSLFSLQETSPLFKSPLPSPLDGTVVSGSLRVARFLFPAAFFLPRAGTSSTSDPCLLLGYWGYFFHRPQSPFSRTRPLLPPIQNFNNRCHMYLDLSSPGVRSLGPTRSSGPRDLFFLRRSLRWLPDIRNRIPSVAF